jgi:hypothetical protein
MKTTRADLPDGQWADIRTSPTHAQYRAIISAMEDAASGRGSMIEWASTVGRQMCAGWLVRSDDGDTLDLDDEGWDDAPADIIDAICTEAQLAYKAWDAARRPLVKSRNKRLTAVPSSNETNDDSSEGT